MVCRLLAPATIGFYLTFRNFPIALAVFSAIPVSFYGGMLIEPLTSFIVPTHYCGYMGFKMRAGFQDGVFAKVAEEEWKAA